jgi:hypothetical protein
MINQIFSRLHRNLAPAAAAALIVTLALPHAAAPALADTTAAPAASATDGNSAANPGPSITGFRNAAFGMTQEQVRKAVESEFKLPASAISQDMNAIQHTPVLNAQVPDLIPGGGVAHVSYVFGYQSHKLMEINVIWSKAADPKMTAQQLYQNGESLQQYFAGEGFPPQRSTGNIVTANGLLLFRATDPTGNAVLLILSGAVSKDQKSDKPTLDPAALTLVYASDPQHPDVFQLNKGSF